MLLHFKKQMWPSGRQKPGQAVLGGRWPLPWHLGPPLGLCLAGGRALTWQQGLPVGDGPMPSRPQHQQAQSPSGSQAHVPMVAPGSCGNCGGWGQSSSAGPWDAPGDHSHSPERASPVSPVPSACSERAPRIPGRRRCLSRFLCAPAPCERPLCPARFKPHLPAPASALPLTSPFVPALGSHPGGCHWLSAHPRREGARPSPWEPERQGQECGHPGATLAPAACHLRSLGVQKAFLACPSRSSSYSRGGSHGPSLPQLPPALAGLLGGRLTGGSPATAGHCLVPCLFLPSPSLRTCPRFGPHGQDALRPELQSHEQQPRAPHEERGLAPHQQQLRLPCSAVGRDHGLPHPLSARTAGEGAPHSGRPHATPLCPLALAGPGPKACMMHPGQRCWKPRLSLTLQASAVSPAPQGVPSLDPCILQNPWSPC